MNSHSPGHVAHLDRAPASEAGGSGFESRRAHRIQPESESSRKHASQGVLEVAKGNPFLFQPHVGA